MMGFRFAGMPWYFDILSLVLLGTACAVVFGVLPAFAWADSSTNRIPNLLSDKIAEWFWFGLTVLTIIGGYVFAFCILKGWVN